METLGSDLPAWPGGAVQIFTGKVLFNGYVAMQRTGGDTFLAPQRDVSGVRSTVRVSHCPPSVLMIPGFTGSPTGFLVLRGKMAPPRYLSPLEFNNDGYRTHSCTTSARR